MRQLAVKFQNNKSHLLQFIKQKIREVKIATCTASATYDVIVREGESRLAIVNVYQGRSTPYLRPVTIFALFWRRFGVEHVVVYVRVASLFAQAELKQSQ